MKITPNAIAAGVFLLSVLVPASAEINQKIGSAVQAAAGANSRVGVSIDGDTVTLHGYVEDQNSLLRIERAAKRNGARNVILRVLKTN